MPDRMPEDMSDRMPEDMPDRMPEDLPDRIPEDRMPEDMLDRMPNRMSEDMSDRMPEDLPVRKCINVMVGITRSKVIGKNTSPAMWRLQFHSISHILMNFNELQLPKAILQKPCCGHSIFCGWHRLLPGIRDYVGAVEDATDAIQAEGVRPEFWRRLSWPKFKVDDSTFPNRKYAFVPDTPILSWPFDGKNV